MILPDSKQQEEDLDMATTGGGGRLAAVFGLALPMLPLPHPFQQEITTT